jgi:hypothetical protein
MGRPLAKKLFGADQYNNLKCRFNNGSDSVPGFIIKQLGTRTFLCQDAEGNQAVCSMVVKTAGELNPGEMTFTLRFDDNSIVHPTKIAKNLVTVNGFQMPWNFDDNNSDQILQMDEAGYNPQMDGATNLELNGGPFWWNVYGNIALGPQADTIIIGGVVHDSQGYIYVTGQHQPVSGPAENLFLKYSPEGELLQHSTWTNDQGMPCGSYNQSLRIDHAHDDMMYWCSYVQGSTTSYVGDKDKQGNLIQYPKKIENFWVQDLDISDTPGNVYIVGAQFGNNLSPTVALLDINNNTTIWTSNVIPHDSDLSANYSEFHGVSRSDSVGIVTIGSYNTNSSDTAIIMGHYGSEGNQYGIFGIDTSNSYVPAGITVDNNNVYLLMNTVEFGQATITKLEYTGGLGGSFTQAWSKQAQINGCVSTLGTSLVVEGGNLWVSGTAAGGAPPVPTLVRLDTNTGEPQNQLLFFPGDGDGATIPLSDGPLGVFLAGTSDISIYDDRIAFGSYTFNEGYSTLAAFMTQVPLSLIDTGNYGGTTVLNEGFNAWDDLTLNFASLSASEYRPDVAVTQATLLATASTNTVGFGAYHWDYTSNVQIIP